MRLSIIVPVLNEAALVREFLLHLRASAPGAQIIIVDGGSSDGTIDLCRELADRVLKSVPGRARQMNAGAKIASGDILWFVHADSRVAANSVAAIEDLLRDSHVAGGCFRLQLVPSRWIYGVRDAIANLCVSMFGIALSDRGLFCRRENFFAIGGYPDQPLLEDADFYRKLRTVGRTRQLHLRIQTSARRYETLGPVRTALFYFLIMTLYVARVRVSILEKMVDWFYSNKPAAKEPSGNTDPVIDYLF